MKILLLCLNAFETMEFSPFVDVMGWARDDYGCDVQVVIGGYTRKIVSTFGVAVTADILMDEVNADDYDALAVPGGFEEYGFYQEAYQEQTLDLIREFVRRHKPIASVCVAALPLAKSGILQSRKATTYHLDGGHRRSELEQMGAVLGNEWLEVDDNIITSSCPRTAPEVAFRLLGMLTSEEKALQVRQAMGY